MRPEEGVHVVGHLRGYGAPHLGTPEGAVQGPGLPVGLAGERLIQPAAGGLGWRDGPHAVEQAPGVNHQRRHRHHPQGPNGMSSAGMAPPAIAGRAVGAAGGASPASTRATSAALSVVGSATFTRNAL